MCLPNLEDKEKACQVWWSHTENNDPEVSLQIWTMRGSAVLIQSESWLHFLLNTALQINQGRAIHSILLLHWRQGQCHWINLAVNLKLCRINIKVKKSISYPPAHVVYGFLWESFPSFITAHFVVFEVTVSGKRLINPCWWIQICLCLSCTGSHVLRISCINYGKNGLEAVWE